ncbi:hypothetical protein RND71_018033 [Anisodus tanguticus]|uniref:Uncharacterized protein n=1 Tax=Anisodus tanguticus TaxID=243964 RepID=A0AAE1S4V7_9SOLA|nr:hypothetical protein RND71_018033 [Anisodus tanguticus]
MEGVAQKFEAEEGMHCEVEQKMTSEPYLWMQTSFPCIQGKYHPYCEIMPSITQNNEATTIKMSSIRRSSAQGKKKRDKKKEIINQTCKSRNVSGEHYACQPQEIDTMEKKV